MGKLSRLPPISELNVPGRIEHIVNGLFPQNPRRDTSSWHHNQLLGGIQWKVDLAELKTAESRLRNKIVTGIEDIPNEAVKLIVALNPSALLSVYNTYLAESIFLRTWKIARLVLLRKGDKPLGELSSYRPLCLLDCLGKFFKKILDARLRRHLDDTEGLDNTQFEFRNGRLTTDALNTLKSTIKATNLKISILTMDIKNAFN